jgi:hypothetical protein
MEMTKDLREPCLVLQKSKQALSSSKVNIGVFENSQKGTNFDGSTIWYVRHLLLGKGAYFYCC